MEEDLRIKQIKESLLSKCGNDYKGILNRISHSVIIIPVGINKNQCLEEVNKILEKYILTDDQVRYIDLFSETDNFINFTESKMDLSAIFESFEKILEDFRPDNTYIYIIQSCNNDDEESIIRIERMLRQIARTALECGITKLFYSVITRSRAFGRGSDFINLYDRMKSWVDTVIPVRDEDILFYEGEAVDEDGGGPLLILNGTAIIGQKISGRNISLEKQINNFAFYILYNELFSEGNEVSKSIAIVGHKSYEIPIEDVLEDGTSSVVTNLHELLSENSKKFPETVLNEWGIKGINELPSEDKIRGIMNSKLVREFKIKSTYDDCGISDIPIVGLKYIISTFGGKMDELEKRCFYNMLSSLFEKNLKQFDESDDVTNNIYNNIVEKMNSIEYGFYYSEKYITEITDVLKSLKDELFVYAQKINEMIEAYSRLDARKYYENFVFNQNDELKITQMLIEYIINYKYKLKYELKRVETIRNSFDKIISLLGEKLVLNNNTDITELVYVISPTYDYEDDKEINRKYIDDYLKDIRYIGQRDKLLKFALGNGYNEEKLKDSIYSLIEYTLQDIYEEHLKSFRLYIGNNDEVLHHITSLLDNSIDKEYAEIGSIGFKYTIKSKAFVGIGQPQRKDNNIGDGDIEKSWHPELGHNDIEIYTKYAIERNS